MKSTVYVIVTSVLWLQVTSTFYKETVYKDTNVTRSDVSVQISSDVPGNLRLFFTDDNFITIVIRLSSDNLGTINNTNIVFLTSPSSLSLKIAESLPETVAAVTGAGSKHELSLWVLLLLVAILVQKDCRLLVCLVVVCGLSQSQVTSSTDHFRSTDGFVDIEIRAPRRLRYKELNLFVNDGNLRLHQASGLSLDTSTCKTNWNTDGCSNCCHGNGACIQDQCFCDLGYDPTSNCKFKKRRDVFYQHPLDSRFSSTELQNGYIITMFDASGIKTHPTHTGETFMTVKSAGSAKSIFQLLFGENGFLKKVVFEKKQKDRVIAFRRPKYNECLLSVNVIQNRKPRRSKLDIDVCNDIGLDKMKDEPFSDTHKHQNNNFVRRRQTSRHARNSDEVLKQKPSTDTIGQLQKEIAVLDVPIQAYSCGEVVPLESSVSFEVIPKVPYNIMTDSNDILTDAINEGIPMFPHSPKGHSQMFLQIPDTRVPISNGVFEKKCNIVKGRYSKLCQYKHMETYSAMCQVGLHQTNSSFPRTNISSHLSKICEQVISSIQHFCDIPLQYFSESLECQESFTARVNFFKNDLFVFKPATVFSDGREISGLETLVSLRNISRSTERVLLIHDSKPAFKIIKVSVIPNDPVPGDIYQVRLDYACATNATVIKMKVTGSDMYTNHVTCHGISKCNCCILHAAGAANAVVDHVLISVEDNYTHVKIVKEMVVIF